MRTQNRQRENNRQRQPRNTNNDFNRDRDVEYRFGDRNNQEDWENFASDRDLFISNGNEQLRDSRRRGYQNQGENGIYGREGAPEHRPNSMDTGRGPHWGGSSSHSGHFYQMDDDISRAESYSENWGGSSNHPGNNAQRGNDPGRRINERADEFTSDRNNRFSGVRSRKNR